MDLKDLKFTIPATISTTYVEREVFFKYCFGRSMKTAIELLEMFGSCDAAADAILQDKIQICIDDLERYAPVLETIRTKVTEAVRQEVASSSEPPENKEWERLLPQERSYMLDVISEAHKNKKWASKSFPGENDAAREEYYASPRYNGGVAWGRNGPPHGWNTHRGVILNAAEWLKAKGR